MATRIYIGNLPMDIRERELDDFFYKVRDSIVEPAISLIKLCRSLVVSVSPHRRNSLL